MKLIENEMQFLRNQLVIVQGAVDRLDVMGVKIKLSILLPKDKKDGCQGTVVALNGYELTVTGKFEKEL